GRGDQRGPHHRLVDPVDLALARLAAAQEVTRVRLPDLLAGVHDDAVDGVRRGGDQGQVEFALQALTDDLHVQQAEEAAAEAEPERVARLRLVQQRGVVQPQLVQRVPQVRIVVAVHRVHAV